MLGTIESSVSGGVAGLSDDELSDAYEWGRREVNRLEAGNAGLLAEIDRRGCFRRYGYLSTTGYVAYRTGDSHQGAAGRVRLARCLTGMPETAAAFAAGDIGVMRVRRLADAREVAPESFAAAEWMLVGQARGLEAGDFTLPAKGP